MAEEKNILEEAIIQMKNLEEAVAENAKGILASTMKQEIKELVKESLNEADEDEEEVEDDEMEDEDMDFEEMEDEMEDDTEDFEEVEFDMEDEMEDEDMMEPEMDSTDTIDLTNAPSSEVLKVFKLLSPDDEIIVTKDSAQNIHLKDEETGKEYMIVKEGDEEEVMTDEMFEMEDEMYEMEDEIYEMDMYEMEDEFMNPEEMEEEDVVETIYEIELDDTEEDDEEFDFSDEEEEEFMMEEKKAMKPKGLVGKGPKFDYGKVVDYPTKKMAKGDELPKGLGKKVKYEFDSTSPSLKGEFSETKHMKKSSDKMEKKEGVMKAHKEETKEASRTLGSGSNFRKGGLPKPRAHSKFNANIQKESVDSQEIQILKEKNEEYRKALNIFRNKLNEVAVFNSNLAYATRLFTEHSTSKQEKINILQRFDGVETLKESKNLYKVIKDELTSTKSQQVNESVERVIAKAPSTGSAVNLIESKTYENPQFLRMKDLMSKLK